MKDRLTNDENMSINTTINKRQKWLYIPIIPGTREMEVGGSPQRKQS
jgi:hypothetical protein